MNLKKTDRWIIYQNNYDLQNQELIELMCLEILNQGKLSVLHITYNFALAKRFIGGEQGYYIKTKNWILLLKLNMNWKSNIYIKKIKLVLFQLVVKATSNFHLV